ncbi:MAG: hypothetical protein HYU28_00680 [Actinobacteria bacterium]|nr:hypothetical protein [Actinomycetota bacterium]
MAAEVTRDSEWSVGIESLVTNGEGVTPAALTDLLDLLHAHAAVVGGQGNRLDARLTVAAESPADAVARTLELVCKAAERVGLGTPAAMKIEAMEASALELDLAGPNFPALVGIAEIADLLSVNRQRASQVARTGAFPAPVAELAMGPVWTAPSVRRFVQQWRRRPGRPRKRATAAPAPSR